MKPITPAQVVAVKESQIPDVVIQSFNRLIAKHWNGRYSKFLQDEVLSEITCGSDLTSNVIFANKYLDIEQVFKDAGWKVSYDAPGYNESYKASFTFTAVQKQEWPG